jgi:hypothetical protein
MNLIEVPHISDEVAAATEFLHKQWTDDLLSTIEGRIARIGEESRYMVGYGDALKDIHRLLKEDRVKKSDIL